jgi:biopolymer transport protein ExbD
MLRGQLDAAPFIMVFFLVLIFVLLGSLTYTPGVHVRLPLAEGFPGTANPTLSVAVDSRDRLYFQNQLLDETELGKRLAAARRGSPEPLTLLVHADRDVSYATLVRVTQVAREAGIGEALLATLPRLYPDARQNPKPKHGDAP